MSHARTNPTPTDAMKAAVYYHGTQTEAWAEKIATEGIVPRSISLVLSGGRGKMKPVVDRVYLTPHLDYAQIYALGANYAGSALPAHTIKDHGRYGYLFVVRGADLRDVEPDEDSVGEAMYHAYIIASPNADYSIHAGVYEGNPLWTNLLRDSQFAYELTYFADRVLTAKQRADVRFGYVNAWASGGKRALKKMSDAQKLKLVAYGAHVAHAGAVMPSEAWRIDKLKSPLLKKNGSNFFEVAERLPWHGASR